jgi:hypothetical protein
MKNFLYLPVLIFIMFACAEKADTTSCPPNDPMNEIEVLKQWSENMGDCTCETSILEGKYNGEFVYYVQLTDPVCDGIDMPTLINCKGKVVRVFTQDDYQEFYSTVTMVRKLYSCSRQ